MNSKEFIVKYTISSDYSDKIDKIVKDFSLDKNLCWKWYEQEKDLRTEINRIKSLYSSRKNDKEFGFKTIDKFYFWYSSFNKCYYCETKFEDIKLLFEKTIKTNSGRGSNPEIDRKNPGKSIPYNSDTSVLSCYICNNSKSDLMDGDTFKETIAPGIKKYYDLKLLELK